MRTVKVDTPINDYTQIINMAVEQILANVLPTQFAGITPTFSPREPDMIYNEWMAGIMLAGPSMRCILKLHFNHPMMQKYCYSNEDLKINDQLKEICNVIAGTFKKYLEQIGVHIGISLPFITSGLDEFLFTEIRKEDMSYSVYDVESSGAKIMTLSHEMELIDKNLIEKFNNLPDVILQAKVDSEESDGFELL
jgi:hypothetical protein